jgi:2-oxoglutarate dehydrogenase E1 component
MARSAAADLQRGSFEEVLPDPASPPDVKRVLFCSGKVAIDLLKRRDETSSGAAIVRLEQLYPFPHARIDEELQRYPGAEVWWVQEEPENMGAWSFVFSRLQHQVRDVQLVARPESASPATGSSTVHAQEQEELLEAAFEGV